jgi:hypothetical protein
MTAFIDSTVFGATTIDLQPSQVGPMFAIYGAGFAAVFLLFAALYGYAYKRRDELELDELEQTLVRGEIGRNVLTAAIAGVSIAFAFALPVEKSGVAGYAYMLVGAVETWHGRRAGMAKRRLTLDPPESDRR